MRRHQKERWGVGISAASENSRTVKWNNEPPPAAAPGPARSRRYGTSSSAAAIPVAHTAAVSRYHFFATPMTLQIPRKIANENATYIESPAAEANASAASGMCRRAPPECHNRRNPVKHAIVAAMACGVETVV